MERYLNPTTLSVVLVMILGATTMITLAVRRRRMRAQPISKGEFAVWLTCALASTYLALILAQAAVES